jgi:hypothetical protein
MFFIEFHISMNFGKEVYLKRNIGKTDRIARASTAVVIGILYFAGILRGTLALVLGIASLALLFTSITGFCSLYVPFGISTVRKCDEPVGKE